MTGSRMTPPCKLLETRKEEAYVIETALCESCDLAAIGLSNNKIKVFPVDIFEATVELDAHEDIITGLKFSRYQPLLYSCSLDKKIHLWDLRCQHESNPVQTFIDESDSSRASFMCFDLTACESVMCAGSEMIREDAFLLFWDLRMSKPMGSFWEFHTDDITRVCFNGNSLASCSDDGLVNVLHLHMTSEDETDFTTVNLNSPVHAMTWGGTDYLSCITSVDGYHMISAKEASTILSFKKDDMFDKYEVDMDVLVDSFYSDKGIHLLTCTFDGKMHMWRISPDGYGFDFALEAEHSDMIRTLTYNAKENLLAVGGDDGIFSLYLCNFD